MRRYFKSMFCRLFVGASMAAVLGGSPLLAYDGDSSADARGGFTRQAEQSNGVIIRVPINEKNEELTSAAEMRVYSGEAPTSVDTMVAAFQGSTPLTEAPTVTQQDINRDSSTWGWNRWSYRGWGTPYYYYYYRPFYYSGFSYYRYTTPYYYNWYSGYPYYGYRYYYYNRWWY